MFKRPWHFLAAAVALMLALTLRWSPQPIEAQPPFTGTATWTAQFYPTTNFTGNAVTATYSALNFNWPGVPTQSNNVTPVAGIPADNFSARFTSTQTAAQTGEYTFTGFADDQIVVFIDNIEVFRQTVPGNFTFNRTLTAGAHSFRIDFVELTQTAILQFNFNLGTANPFVTPSPAGPREPFGTVVQVRGLSLRTGPYLGASFIAVLRPNNAYEISGRSNDEGGPFTWYYVTAGERTGWTSGRYLSVTGNVDTIPFMSNPIESITDLRDRGVVATPRAVMNFRRRPSVRSERIGQIPWGAETELLGRTIQGGRNHWLLVRYNDQVGWIFAPYVSIRGPIEAVPIY
jgi:uncharacterized protein YraI